MPTKFSRTSTDSLGLSILLAARSCFASLRVFAKSLLPPCRQAWLIYTSIFCRNGSNANSKKTLPPARLNCGRSFVLLKPWRCLPSVCKRLVLSPVPLSLPGKASPPSSEPTTSRSFWTRWHRGYCLGKIVRTNTCSSHIRPFRNILSQSIWHPTPKCCARCLTRRRLLSSPLVGSFHSFWHLS